MNDVELEIYDMYCSAYLNLCGVKINRLTVGEHGRVSFHFTDDGLASRCLGDWRTQHAFVDARAYADSLRLTKRLLMTAVNDRQPRTIGEIGNDAVQPATTPR